MTMTNSRSAAAPSMPARMRDPFMPEPWAARMHYLAPGLVRDADQLASFAAAHMQGDALADALAASLADDRDGRQRAAFERALTGGIASVPEADEPLRAFFADVERVPLWLDRARIARASALYHRAFPAAQVVLFSASLLAGYLSAGIAKTLVGTAALERMAVRRLAETQSFVTDLYGPGALAHESAGFRATIRVRLMHGMVRRQLLARGFDVARWGIPINQADMAATVLQFSITYVLALRALGVHVTSDEADAVLHLWRYVGQLLGVRDDLLPRTEAEARQQLRLSAGSQAGPDADSRALTRALLAIPEQLALPRVLHSLARIDFAFRAGFARLLVGKAAADGLNLPDGAAKLAPLALFPVIYGCEWLRRALPFGTRGAVALGRRLAEYSTQTRLQGQPARYVPHDANAVT